MSLFKIGDLLAVQSVDMFGYLGRENHPGPEHVGRLVVITGTGHIVDKSLAVAYRAETLTGQRLEMMDHELALLAAAEMPEYDTV